MIIDFGPFPNTPSLIIRDASLALISKISSSLRNVPLFIVVFPLLSRRFEPVAVIAEDSTTSVP